MARYGALTALQAALLGISGGAQGLVQAREREQKESERVRQAEREAARDALERERFGIEQERSRSEQSFREAQLRQTAELTGKEIASREKVAGMTAGSAAADRALRQRELDNRRKDLLNEATAWFSQNYIGPGATNLPENITPEQRETSNRIARTYSTMRADANKRGQNPTSQELIASVYAIEQARALAEARSRGKGGEVKKPSLDERMRALVALDYSDDQIRETLLSEGYDLTSMR